MREYTKIITIKVIASVMAESEDDAEVSCCGVVYRDANGDPSEYYGRLPTLLHPQVIDVTAYNPMDVSHDSFKAALKEAYRELYPDVEPDCEARPVVFPHSGGDAECNLHCITGQSGRKTRIGNDPSKSELNMSTQ
jgi:hypothetical protein